MRVAAVIPCRNRKLKTLRFLEAFAQQTYADLDVVVVDANSQDGTPLAVAQQFPQVHVISVGDESYWTASTNRGVEWAIDRGYDYILTINDDCVVQPDYVATLLHLAKKYNLPILGSRIDYLEAPGLIWTLGISTHWTKHLFCLDYRDRLVEDLPPAIAQAEVLDAVALAGDGVLIHRSVFEQVGLYQETHLPHYLSDVELVLRAKRQGFRAGVTPQAIVSEEAPTPAQRAAQVPVDKSLWQDFYNTFIHTRSGEKLSAKLYIVLHYCPWYLKPIALGRRFLAVGHWLLRAMLLRCRRRVRSSLVRSWSTRMTHD
jgi:GT2 family glycosyltransferase